MITGKKIISGKWTMVFLGTALFFTAVAFSQNLPEYQGVKPPESSDNTETEAQFQPNTCSALDKNCGRELNAQRDRSPHAPSPQEADNLVRKILKKKTTPVPPTDPDGSR